MNSFNKTEAEFVRSKLNKMARNGAGDVRLYREAGIALRYAMDAIEELEVANQAWHRTYAADQQYIGNMERKIAALQEANHKLAERIIDLSWAAQPEEMGR